MIGFPPKILGLTVILCKIFLSSIWNSSFAPSTPIQAQEKALLLASAF
jgi:hypothetical protein